MVVHVPVDETVLYEVSDHIATITLNRPETLNALVPGMGSRYAELLHRADDDPQVRAIIVTGAGRGFCSGADLRMLSDGSDALGAYLQDQTPQTLPTIALRLRTPVITAINGPCAGIGFVLAISADFRVASHQATFTTAFARLGLIAEYGISWLLPRLVGLPRATDLLLRGETISAEQAQAMGLVSEVADDAATAARALASQLIHHCSPASMAVMKAQLLQTWNQDLDESVSEALGLMAESFQRNDLGEALQARVERRPPNFPGLGQ
jgi:enoyl-CoA hydratase/carnithine racemase